MNEPPLPDAGPAWQLLGIAPTRDQTEIRRAYVRRLKAIDPDTDPQAFISLREARDLVVYLSWYAANEGDRAADDEAPPEAGPDRANAPAPDPGVETVFQTPGAVDEGAIDPELFARIERLLFGSEAAPDRNELHRAAAALFSDPGLDRIGAAESVQDWTVHTIVNSSPRSDAMLEPAIARFRWEEGLTDWRRPPVLDWILRRREDAHFEHALVSEFPRYEAVLGALRTRDAAPPQDPDWGFADDVRAFLSYTRLHHPTSVSLCDPDALAWWDDFLLHPPTFMRRRVAPIARFWHGRGGPDGLFQPRQHRIQAGLVIGMIMMPIVFAWPFFRPRYPWFMRVIALAWLGLYVTAIIVAPPLPVRAPSPSAAARPLDPAIDLNPILSRQTGGELDLSMLQSQNQPLYDALVDLWRAETAPGGDFPRLEVRVASLLDSAQREGIRNADSLVQEDYWRLRLGQLIWLRDHLGTGYCDRFDRGELRETLLFPADMQARARDVRTRILRYEGEPAPRAQTISIPGSIVEEVRQRTRLPRREIDDVLAGRSTAAKRCDVRIALIEAALALPREESQRLIHDMSSLE